MDLLVGSMHEHRIFCIMHIIFLCSLTVWFSVNVNWYGAECYFVPSYYCPHLELVHASVDYIVHSLSLSCLSPG